MNPETIKQSIQAIVDGLTPLAQKLQIPIEGLFGWAIKHNYALAVSYFLVPLISLIIFALLFRYFRKEENDNDNTFMIIWSLGFAFVISLIIFLVCLPDAIDRLIAPEWNAANDIIQMIK